MNYAGFLRVKNESRWLQRVLASLQPLCERTYLLDDHSTDDTRRIAMCFPSVTVYESPFDGLDETRDMNYLLGCAIADDWADYLIAIDGDEELHKDSPNRIRQLCEERSPLAVSLRIIYLWDTPDQWRSDGVYGHFYRPSIFRMMTAHREFLGTVANGNLHCTHVPSALVQHAVITDIKLLHWGYFDSALRAKKHAYYNRVDPLNKREDYYRHIIQGDPGGPDSNAKLLHGGPLLLEPLGFKCAAS